MRDGDRGWELSALGARRALAAVFLGPLLKFPFLLVGQLAHDLRAEALKLLLDLGADEVPKQTGSFLTFLDMRLDLAPLLLAKIHVVGESAERLDTPFIGKG